LIEFEISNKKILIESPLNPDDYQGSLDDVIQKYSSDDRIPFWIDVWPSAIAIAEFILESDEFSNKKVLELGCGLGLTTVALGFKNAITTATDYEMIALQFAKRNYIRNIGNDENVKFVFLDWRTPSISEKFDLVIGADIIYERNLFKNIVDIFKNAMTTNSTCYLADPGRPMSFEFFEILKSERFDFKIISRSKVSYRNSRTDVLIYKIKKA
jgi:predicted nicotinamide N-methyase